MGMGLRVGSSCLMVLSCMAVVFAALPMRGAEQAKPNIVYVLCDDLGYGDVRCFNPERGRVPTPHADALAKQGMMFTDAHSGSSVCTPTRYGLLTGRYSWRTPLQRGVVTGFAPNLIAEDRPTVAGFLRSHGYHTGIVGKWHLNFLYVDAASGEPITNKRKSPPVGSLIPDGPTTRGFDYYHGFHHSRDMKTVSENGRVIAHDPPINMLPRLTEKSVAYIDARAADGKPFFLYVPLGSPHTPIVPTDEWKGRSGLGDYADFVMQTDHALGEICKALERHGLAEDTIVIFTSDNGCAAGPAKAGELAEQGHDISGPLRGAKSDIWDGGHRVPFIVRWPGVVEAGSTSGQVICHTDLFATLGELLGEPLPGGAAEDSVSFLPALHGKPIQTTRAGVVHHSFTGHFAYRMGDWKLVLARGSGGWSSPRENAVGNDAPKGQLYNMAEDVGESENLFVKRPEVVKRLLEQFTADVYSGRSTQGAESDNDVADEVIVLWKSEAGGKAG